MSGILKVHQDKGEDCWVAHDIKCLPLFTIRDLRQERTSENPHNAGKESRVKKKKPFRPYFLPGEQETQLKTSKETPIMMGGSAWGTSGNSPFSILGPISLIIDQAQTRNLNSKFSHASTQESSRVTRRTRRSPRWLHSLRKKGGRFSHAHVRPTHHLPLSSSSLSDL